jgi:hypothetical protein
MVFLTSGSLNILSGVISFLAAIAAFSFSRAKRLFSSGDISGSPAMLTPISLSPASEYGTEAGSWKSSSYAFGSSIAGAGWIP